MSSILILETKRSNNAGVCCMNRVQTFRQYLSKIPATVVVTSPRACVPFDIARGFDHSVNSVDRSYNGLCSLDFILGSPNSSQTPESPAKSCNARDGIGREGSLKPKSSHQVRLYTIVLGYCPAVLLDVYYSVPSTKHAMTKQLRRPES